MDKENKPTFSDLKALFINCSIKKDNSEVKQLFLY